MKELFPLVAGGLVGGMVMLIRSLRLRAAAFVVGCLVFGVLASFFSGELEESLAFISVDMALVWLGGLVAVVILTAGQFFLKSPRGANKQ